MRRLLIVFVVLVGIAVGATVAGILLSDREGGSSFLGPTVLVWRVQGPVPEQARTDVFGLSGYAQTSSVADLYRGFRDARDAPEVRGLAVYLRSTGFGLAKAQEFRRQLEALSSAGKFVECYFESVGEGSNGTLGYYLATGCDRIYLSPLGDVNLLGLYADALYLRGGLDKLGIEPEFLSVGEYKSAGEQFTRTGRSDEAREAIDAVLDGELRLIVEAIAAERSMSTEEVQRLIDTAPHSAEEALDLGLIDGILYPDEFRDRIEELAGGEPSLVHLDTFRRPRSGGVLGGGRVAVVFAAGTIVRGLGGVEPWTEELFLGSDDLTEVLRRLAEDDAIAAVVLRIDSPGGSALASDLILREVELLAAEKPVIVSMSDVAASGGYYIAAKADKIVAEAATVTGSIGVILGRFATGAFERETLGVTRDPLSRGANAGLFAGADPLTEAERETLRDQMETIYRAFVGHVAEGRGMSEDAVDGVARGRVWLGSDAAELGLVDELGGLDRAVELAVEAAGLPADEPVRLIYYPEPESLLELLFGRPRPLLPASLSALAKGLSPAVRGALHAPPEIQELATPF
jgi:protease IV